MVIEIKKSDRYKKISAKLIKEISNLDKELEAKLEARTEEIKEEINSLYKIKLKPERNKFKKFVKKCKFKYSRKYKTLNGKYFEREIFLGDEKIGIISYFDEKEKVLNLVDLIRYKKSDKKNIFNIVSNILLHPVFISLVILYFIYSIQLLNYSNYMVKIGPLILVLGNIILYNGDSNRDEVEYEMGSNIVEKIRYSIYSPVETNWVAFGRMLYITLYMSLLLVSLNDFSPKLVIFIHVLLIFTMFALLIIEVFKMVMKSAYIIVVFISLFLMGSFFDFSNITGNSFLLGFILLLLSGDIWKIIKTRDPIKGEFFTEKNNMQLSINIFKIKIQLMMFLLLLYFIFIFLKETNIIYKYNSFVASYLDSNNKKWKGLNEFIKIIYTGVFKFFVISLVGVIWGSFKNSKYKADVDSIIGFIYSKVYGNINLDNVEIPKTINEFQIGKKFIDKINPEILITNREEIPKDIQVFLEGDSISPYRRLLIIYPNRRIYECKYLVKKNKIKLEEEIKLINE